MVYIEFFEKNATENICACLAASPEHIIMLGDDVARMQKMSRVYQSIAKSRGHTTQFSCISVNTHSLRDITQCLDGIVCKYNSCVFDLTGGDDLFLVATGIIYNKYPQKEIQLIHFNILNGTVIDCDGDGKPELAGVPMLSIEENVMIYGGDVVYDLEKRGSTYRWDMNSRFIEDIDAMWEICRVNVKEWNAQISLLERACSYSRTSFGDLEFSVDIKGFSRELEAEGTAFFLNDGIMSALVSSGLITKFEHGKRLTVRFKSSQVKRCLTKAGQVLEMKIYSLAQALREKDGTPTYNDAMNGVSINWEGSENAGKYDTENEIDVMLMHGAVPIFISCKNGFIDMEELYKLDTVAQRFGGRYAKKVLVTTALDTESHFGRSLINRAHNMGITLITRAHTLSDLQLEEQLRGLCINL